MIIIYNKGLSKELLNAIKNREYNHENLMSIYQELQRKKSDKNKGMRTAIIIFAICAVFVLAISMMNYFDFKTLIIMAIVFAFVFVIVFTFLRVNFVNKAKRQFMNALQIGYPELIEKFDSLN